MTMAELNLETDGDLSVSFIGKGICLIGMIFKSEAICVVLIVKDKVLLWRLLFFLF
jgi:hypothetical protein